MAAPKSTFVATDVIESSWLNEIAKLAATRQSVAIGGSGDYTLSSTEYQCRTIRLTGTLTGNRNVIVPGDGGRTWAILNATSGSYSVTVKVSGGAGIVIRQGYCAVVREDGTDVLRVTPDVTNAGVLAAVGDILDTNGNEEIKFTATASAVNEITVANAATGNKPKISASGDDSNISLELVPKGTGGIVIGSGGYGIKKVLGASTTVDPTSISDGDDYAISVNVPGAVPGDLCLGSLALLVTNDVLVSAHVHTADYVKVLLLNRTGGSLDLGSGTINVLVFQI